MSFAESKTDVLRAIPKWMPLRREVLGLALRYAGAPYVWGGTSPTAQSPFGSPVSGGFDCSGLRLVGHEGAQLPVPGTTWSGAPEIQVRTTYQMAAAPHGGKPRPAGRPAPGRHPVLELGPERRPHPSATVYHTGIYLGNGWTINSHGSGDGVTIDYMGPGAGWYHDAFAFGWRVMPMHVGHPASSRLVGVSAEDDTAPEPEESRPAPTPSRASRSASAPSAARA